MAKNYLIFGLALCLSCGAHAQGKISAKDAKEINFQAREIIQRGLQNLLNTITNKDEPSSYLDADIANSYDSTSINRIFKDSVVIVDDDIDPQANLGDKKSITVQKYLNDISIKYERTRDASIAFSGLDISAVKKRMYIYVRVKFDERFGSKYKLKAIPYPSRQREALIKIENAGGNKWNAIIMGIYFYDLSDPIDTIENNMIVTKDSTLSSEVVTQEELNKQQQEFNQAKAAEQKKKDAQFQGYFNNGRDYLTKKRYKDALQMFAKAKEINPLDPSLEKITLDSKKDSAGYTYGNFKNKGDKEKRENQFEAAIQYYEQALSLNPDDKSLRPLIDSLAKKNAVLSQIKKILQSGDARGAIKECDRILDLRVNRSLKGNFPELYYIEGLAYQKMLENDISDADAKQNALDNFNLAIKYSYYYTEALKARAYFNVRYKGDIGSAILDYDQLTSITLDTAAEKPGYFVQEAKWKDQQMDYPDAISDYTKAIALMPKADSIYYYRGKLYYRWQKFAEAKKDFDAAITLNPLNSAAIYTRGLDFIKLHNYDKAGEDFVEAEGQSISAEKTDTIQSISNEFCLMAGDSVSKHHLIGADNSFNIALKIWNCNPTAYMGKASIRYEMGKELMNRKQTDSAKKSFEKSIEYNKDALKCNLTLPDAFYIEGLAWEQTGENDKAIESFTDAIRVDIDNINAYIERGKVEQLLKNYKNAENDYMRALRILQINYNAAKSKNNKEKLKGIIAVQANAYELDGEAQYYLMNYTDVIAACNHALERNEYNSEALYYRGLAYSEIGELSKSIDDFSSALDISPLCKYYFAKGLSSLKNRNYGVAVDYFGYTIQRDSLNTFKNKYYLRGIANFKNKSINDGFSDFEEYNKSETSKTDSDFLVDYGMAQLNAGKNADAFQNFNRALNLSANNAQALFGLGCYYAVTGGSDKVLAFMEKAFSKHALNKDYIASGEDAFLGNFTKDRRYRNKYEELKRKYILSR